MNYPVINKLLSTNHHGRNFRESRLPIRHRPTHKRKKALFLGPLVLWAIGLSFPAHASYIQTLNFTANNQSLWGAGGGSGFDYSGYAGTTLLGLKLGVGYDIGASSGTVSDTFKGRMAVNYSSTLSQPGTTQVDLSFGGISRASSLSTDLGYKAQLCPFNDQNLCVGPSLDLNIDKNYTAKLDQTVADTAAVDNVVQVPLIDIYAASAGAEMGISQTASFVANAVHGILDYTLVGSGVINQTPFGIPNNAGVSLDLALLNPGTWDFWFADQTLDNTFSTSLNMDIGLYAQAGICPFCATATKTLISPTIYSGDPFALAFNSITDKHGFSIQVNAPTPATVPEPATLTLLGIGLAGMARLRRKNSCA